jgi:hypothetical protein
MTSDAPWQVTGVSSRTRQVARDAAQSGTSPGDTDQMLASDSGIAGAKLSVIPNRGGRSDLIAAARRAAQVASGDAATDHDACAITQAAVLASAGRLARLHVLLGATAAILIVLGLLQIVRSIVSPSAETALMTPNSVGPHIVPSDVPAVASGGDPALAASVAGHLGSAPDLEVTGKVPRSSGTAAATAASAASVKPCPPREAPTSTLPCLVLGNKKESGRGVRGEHR